MLDRTLLLAVVAGALCAGTYASCANSCSGHGTCGAHDKCTCYAKWEGTDCSLRSCPHGPAFADGGNSANPHGNAECSGRGVCDHTTGDCTCAVGYTGQACSRMACPNDCSGHGRCSSIRDISDNKYDGWAGQMAYGCVCDAYYEGADCSMRKCPRGDDPLTVEVECQGTSSGSQTHEVQEITVTADSALSGEITLTHTDAYGQAWTTVPIPVGGDNSYDVRFESGASDKCSFTYASADAISATAGVASSDFLQMPTSKFTSATACGATSTTAPQIKSIIAGNPAFKGVYVSKNADAAAGTKFEVEVDSFNFQSTIGHEVGSFAVSTSEATVHLVGDRSSDIERALESLPYGVIPSVTVSRVAVDGTDDVTSGTNVGNLAQQKYRVTFDDAANAGDQSLLQCNAEGCDEDGCAPRYKGAIKRRYLTTKTGSDPMDATNGVTDFRSTFKATGQGSFRIRHSSIRNGQGVISSSKLYGVDTSATYLPRTEFEAGTYTLHWEVSPGNVDTCTFGFAATQSQIQTALQTITGWEGVSVACDGDPGYANFDCKATYPSGYDDGGKVPWITYTNLQIDATQDQSGLHHLEDIDVDSTGGISAYCLNELCHFSGAFPARLLINDVGNYLYIRDQANPESGLSGVYEVIRVENLQTNVHPGNPGDLSTNTAALVVYAPGVANCAIDDCFNGDVTVWYTTPLMVMWPEFSNTIAIHDTTFRMSFGGHEAGIDVSQDFVEGGTSKSQLVIVWDSYLGHQAIDNNRATSAVYFGAGTSCDNFLAGINGFTNFPVTCDCRRTDAGAPTFVVEVDIRCPGWVGFELSIADTTTVGEAPRDSDGHVPYHRYLRNIPDRSLEQLIAIGDDVSIVSGSSVNQYRTFKAQSYVHDNRWGDGKKNVWSLRMRGAGNGLGGDITSTTTGSALLLAEVDYKSYGDFVPFLKVSPSPENDVAITDIRVEGNNGTHFTRTIEDLSTSTYETATLFIRDKGGSVGSNRLAANPRGITGTFQLTYDGAETNTIQAQATAAEMQDALASLSTLAAVPQVTHRAILDYLVWTITFDAQTGDASKLKFKYVASGSEMKSSLLVGTDGNFLANGRTVDKDMYIWLTYSGQGSAFFDELSQAATSTHDELAMDVVAGTTFNVTSQEIIHWWLFDEAGTSSPTNVAGVGATLPSFVFEYQGAMSDDVPVYDGADFQAESVFAGKLDDLPGMGTVRSADIVCTNSDGVGTNWAQDAAIDSTFNSQFSWGTDHAGAAILHCAFTLPMGADGSQFAVHTSTQADGPAWHNGDEQTFTYRERNNNGRTFTVTKAYENKVSDLISIASVATPGNAASEVGSLYGDFTVLLKAGGGSFPYQGGGNIKYEPGVHYGLRVDGFSGTTEISLGSCSVVPTSCTSAEFGAGGVGLTTATVGYATATFDGAATTGTASDTANSRDSDTCTVANAATGALTGRIGGVVEVALWDGANTCDIVVTSFDAGSGATAMVVVDDAGEIVLAKYTSPGAGYITGTHSLVIRVPVQAAHSASDGDIIFTGGEANVIQAAGIPGKVMEVDTGSVPICATAATDTYGSVYGELSSADAVTNQMLSAMSATVDCYGTVQEVELWSGDCKDTSNLSPQTNAAAASMQRGGTRSGVISLSDGAHANTYNLACDANGVPTASIGGTTSEKMMVGDLVTINAIGGFSDSAIVLRVKAISDPLAWGLRILEGGKDRVDRDRTSSDLVSVASTNVGAGGGAVASAGSITDVLSQTYTVASFYDTLQPRWFSDATHANVAGGVETENVKKYNALSVYGGRTNVMSSHDILEADNWRSDSQQLFKGIDTAPGVQLGYNRGSSSSSNEGDASNRYHQTTSVVADDDATALNVKSEAAELYAYAGRGYDTLWVTPTPDQMTGVRAVLTYTGPSGGCSVAEVTRGSHEGAVCSGRGICDHTTGTCQCDAGYTLEACSEQTVLV